MSLPDDLYRRKFIMPRGLLERWLVSKIGTVPKRLAVAGSARAN
ncbi:MAG: hypothetical protein WCD18_08365 [Thermosynechococcaceae cyanobacterium]